MDHRRACDVERVSWGSEGVEDERNEANHYKGKDVRSESND